ncbi:MAG: B12-binding domain-containing radical SAM protein [Deltaproteobacteria bacterium]|nr:B12-binding domain-containing radical SAM protein [Deltaproteobacteria bacterium]
MKVLMLQPPIRDFYDTDIRLQPLGLCMLKAAIKKHLPSIDVIVKNYHQGYGRKTISYPPEFSYLKGYYSYPDAGPFSMFHQFYHFGAAYNEIARDVKKEHPDMIGISSLFTPFYQEALACAGAIKKILNVPIIMGGPHVSAEPISMLKDPNVDFVIRGEGERPMVQFLKAFQNNEPMDEVPNLGFKKHGEPILNPIGKPYDLNDLPWADFSDFPIDRYLYEKKPLCFLTTSRGCPHKCSFCSVHLTFGKGCRQRSVDDIVTEIKTRYEKGYRVFDFEDDNLTFYGDSFKSLLKRIIKEIPIQEIRFLAMNGISYMSLDREILGLMKQAGFKSLNISLVSARAETLSRVRRPHTLKKFLEVVEQASHLEFDMVAYQILGLPSETLNDMIDTMILLASLPVLIGASIFYLIPGSPMAEEFPAMTPADMVKARSTAMAIESEHFNRDDLYTLFITARIINFIKGLKSDVKRVHLQDVLAEGENLTRKNKIGAELIKFLFKEKVLYAAKKEGYIPLLRFQTDLFYQIWEKVPHIIAQNGSVIGTKPF